MPNLRIIYDNAADRAASLIASNTAGSTNILFTLNDAKGRIHRSTGLSVSYTLTWTNPESIGGVSLPASNLSGEATIRVRLYSDTAATALLVDSGTIFACPGNDIELWNWNLPLNANAFAFGGASKSTLWFDSHHAARACVIDLVDTSANVSGYIDCARLVVGSYWEPERHVQNGSMQIELVDLSTTERSEGGDLVANRSIKHDRLRFDLAYLEETDRQQFMRIARLAGKSRNILVTVFPDNTNSVISQDTTIYGKVVNFAQSQQFYGFYSVPLEIEGW